MTSYDAPQSRLMGPGSSATPGEGAESPLIPAHQIEDPSEGLQGPAGRDQERRSPWTPYLVLALPVLCCGGPLLVVAAATVGATVLGVAAGALVLVGGAAGLVVLRSRRASHGMPDCCAPEKDRR